MTDPDFFSTRYTTGISIFAILNQDRYISPIILVLITLRRPVSGSASE